MLILYMSIVVHTLMARHALSVRDRDHMVHKAQNTYYLGLYRKSLSTLALDCKLPGVGAQTHSLLIPPKLHAVPGTQ